MRIAHALIGLALCPPIAFGAIDSGSWSLAAAEQGKVQFSLARSGAGHHSETSSPWQLAELHGLDWATAAKHDVHFTIARDAGTIDCNGVVEDERGGGLFTFKPNPQYLQEMQQQGFSFKDDQLFSATVFDVSVEFVRALKGLSVQGLDAGKLLAFRIHGVSPEFVRDLRAAGVQATEADRLIAYRIHGVSPEFAGELTHLGYAHAPPEQLIALRIHGVTPEYIESLRSKGLQNLTLDQLISMRIHGID